MAAIDALFEELIRRGGSDLHLAPQRPPHARIRGEIVPLRDAPIGAKELEAMLLEGVGPAQRARLAADASLSLSLSHKDVVRFRGTYHLAHGGLSAAFRLVPLRAPTLAELGGPPGLWRLTERTHGLVLVASPSSNGKTTTQAAMVGQIVKTRPCHVVCLEDPIELVHEPDRAQVTQREIGTHAPSLSHALANVARESPDVVVVSELEGAEHVEHVLRLAASGVLVIATYRAGSVAGAIDRLVATFPAEARPRFRARLAACLAGVVAQHLVRSPSGDARVAVHEILLGTPEVGNLVAEGKTHALRAAMSAGADAGMQALDDTLERMVNAGKIAPAAAFERALDKHAFARVPGTPAF